MLLKAFQNQLHTNFDSLKQAKLLIAISGGLDSMVLTDICIQSDLNIALAHCNFKLRGEESDGDASFITTFASERNLKLHLESFETSAYAKKHKLSTQMAARELRYDWFHSLLALHQYDFILTAHHASDAVETFLINLGRGTGIEGLTGINEQHQKVVRPLLTFSRKQIVDYANSQAIQWREDSSNASDAYVRNHLRHHAIPAMEAANENFERGFHKTQQYLKQSAALLKVYEGQLRQEVTYPIHSVMGPTGWAIDIEKLNAHEAPEAVLYVLLRDCQFKAWEDIYALIDGQTGKQVFSPSHRVLKNRDSLQIFPVENIEAVEYHWEENKSEISGAFGRMEAQEVAGLEHLTKNEIIIDGKELNFPLSIRRWKAGDFFYPMGFVGKKKLSKYFKDEKVSLAVKEYIWVLCSGPDIVWVIGYRADNRYRITENTTQFLKIKITNETT